MMAIIAHIVNILKTIELYMFFFFLVIIYFWLCWIFIAVRLPLVAVNGGSSLVAVRGFLIAVASRCRALVLGARASVAVVGRL